MKLKTLGAAALIALCALNPVFAQENAAGQTTDALVGKIETGKKLYRRSCRQCHGSDAQGAASYPKLAGLPVEEIVDKLTRFRAGERSGPNSALMIGAARRLKDQNIADLAAFLNSLEEA